MTESKQSTDAPPQARPHPPLEEMYRLARRYSRREEETDDLVQDLLLEAVRTGKDFSDVQFLAWGHGFLRNRAAFIARTEGRRRKRETLYSNSEPVPDATGIQLPEAFVTRLRPSLRIIARLVNCGLNRKEILYLLALADTALRQRLTALRREWHSYASGNAAEADRIEAPEHLLKNGLIRRSLRLTSRNAADRERNVTARIIGSHDPDGHLFTIRAVSAHKQDNTGNNNSDKGEKSPG